MQKFGSFHGNFGDHLVTICGYLRPGSNHGKATPDPCPGGMDLHPAMSISNIRQSPVRGVAV